jgi:DNA-binding IclR family transcriptional regulator
MLQETSSRKTPWSKRNELVVKDAGHNTQALGLAIAVNAGGEARGAIEITVPAATMDGAELRAEHGEQLRRASEELQLALTGEDGETCIAGLAS